MVNSDLFAVFSCPSLGFLKQRPALSDILLTDCNYDLDEVAGLVESLLDAPHRCQQGFYIQAVTTGYRAFLASNLLKDAIAEITPTASSWLLGRSAACAIPVQHRSVSRRHATIGHYPLNGFYIADLGSLNGTWINQKRIAPMERVQLQDGDRLKFGSFQIEFFVACRSSISSQTEETFG